MRSGNGQRATVNRLLLACLLAAAGGCAERLGKHVDMDKLKDMSRQGQIWIYDAENEIVVALDRLDDARDEVKNIERRLKQAEEAVESAERRNNRVAVEMAEEWVKYLEAMKRWALARVRAQKIGVIAAEAAVELAKAQVINREDLLGGKDFSVSDYQAQYDDWKKAYEKEQRKASSLRKAARRLEQRWWVLRRRNIAQTGDHDTGLWIE
jgi:chromosome segregation ATPase